MGRKLKIGGGVALALVVIVAGGVALGVFGVPSVTGVENRFGPVNESNTTIETNLSVNNPNPVSVALGGVAVNYSVAMNGVDVANGQKEGVAISSGNSTVDTETTMDNGQIPMWWYTHVRDGETTTVDIDATATSSTLGQSATFGQEQTIETDIVGQFDSNETRPIEANQPLISDPVLYINSTRGSWDRANLTRQRTPLDLDFTVYNPKRLPYTVSKIGYDVTMNGVPVGAGESDRGYVIEPGTTETIRANTVIRNQRLDEWWVSHLERNQVTDLSIDFYLVVDVQGEQFRVDLDSIDHEQRIETDIFGNKPTTEGGTNDRDSTSTVTATATGTDDGILGTGTSTETQTDGQTATPTTTDGGSTTDDGGIIDGSGVTDDGVL